MLVDANLLLYAVDRRSPRHEAAGAWLEDVLNGSRRVGIPWQSIGAFVRIVTHPRVTTDPLTAEQAWGRVESWLAADTAWIPPATERTAAVLARLVLDTPATGNLVTDAQLAALAIEHGLVLCSADTDFGRFADLRWENPLR
ncbi:MAG: PIN domain-containing protein [Acidimicrobiia bacterium]|nr:PIN domain-containing protein [Acidimicrobiia bacterium]